MIKFFRKIRQNLLMENKTGKYVKYAIGEIALVVIGILIALSINNWNQESLNNIERNQLLKGLNNEFKQNKKQLQDIVNAYDKSKKVSIELMTFIGIKNIDKSKIDTINILIDGIFPYIDYLPSNNAIDDIIQSGKLKRLDNAMLSSKLSDWKTLIYILESREKKLDDWTMLETLPYLDRYISWRDIGVSNNYGWSTKGKLPTDYNFILNDLEFENILENHIFFVNQSKNRYEEIINLVEEIILITNK